ncbi:hypothetical protein MF406_09555 [Georgenia sp. TF02-10]|uniref:hypothetical protein n=1 Tax=Georgenia sp. TF02-10 TaxID=2917725 RepID=UPI001FA73568|nr:hypothetical protein [Georgenia sp. TF02-10]UNX53272.1 hypothetical protein MF406_09555 [Georgenia sp. TF02-10]
MDDHATVTIWDAADSLGAVTTQGAGHDVWINYTMLRGLRAEDMRPGMRVHVTYEPTPYQDGYTWIGIDVRPASP